MVPKPKIKYAATTCSNYEEPPPPPPALLDEARSTGYGDVNSFVMIKSQNFVLDITGLTHIYYVFGRPTELDGRERIGIHPITNANTADAMEAGCASHWNVV